jgi:hypothetical protein
VLVVAGVHFQQYVDFMSQVPTVGVLFLLNAAGGAGLVFFGYSEPSLRLPIVIAVLAELAVLPVAGVLLAQQLTGDVAEEAGREPYVSHVDPLVSVVDERRGLE